MKANVEPVLATVMFFGEAEGAVKGKKITLREARTKHT